MLNRVKLLKDQYLGGVVVVAAGQKGKVIRKQEQYCCDSYIGTLCTVDFGGKILHVWEKEIKSVLF